jgi:DNA modification methylase
MKDKSVQCVVTSPPYWGLRDYGTATWVGGDEGCDHKPNSTNRGKREELPKPPAGWAERSEYEAFKKNCRKCGATRIDSQIGLEPTPDEYVAKIVAVFAEVWRVLRDDGTCWVNLGDSYASAPAGNFGPNMPKPANGGAYRENKPRMNYNGLKPKDLVGIPWRVAFAMQAAGWYLRSDIIWAKPNPMPESVTDRPTKSHEYIFLLSKRERYYFDQDAVREDSIDPESLRPEGRNPRNADQFTQENSDSFARTRVGFSKLTGRCYPTRNIRTVWEIATQPYPEAHFATFPEEIAIRCIKAGTSERGACAECGAPWGRVTETFRNGKDWNANNRAGGNRLIVGQSASDRMPNDYRAPKTLGWQPTCKHDAPTVPCVVLDPFSGAGTVPLVADKLNRRGIGLELKADYCRMASRRCYDDAPLLAVT